MSKLAENSPGAPALNSLSLTKPLVLVGLMGAGKTTIGRRLAARLGVSFVDSDAEIEAAAGYSVQDIFDKYGEAAFREGERKVMLRLLKGPMQVIATGGGAFMDLSIITSAILTISHDMTFITLDDAFGYPLRSPFLLDSFHSRYQSATTGILP